MLSSDRQEEVSESDGLYLFETPIPGPIESKIKLRHLQQANHLRRVGAIGWVDGFEPTDVDSSEAASEFVDLQRWS